MSEIIKSAIVPYDSDKMLSLVNDVVAYPKFLKWCVEGFIQHNKTDYYEAGMVIQIKGFQVEFVTRNEVLYDGDMTCLYMSLVKGPFKKLSGEWRFHQYPEFGSKVELQLQYEIKSQLLGKMFAKGFDQLATNLVNDFVNRAGVVYARS